MGHFELSYCTKFYRVKIAHVKKIKERREAGIPYPLDLPEKKDEVKLVLSITLPQF